MLISDKGLSIQSCGFSCGHVWMWELDHKESWVPKNWCFWTVVLEKTLESPLECKEIQPVHPKGNQSWIFLGRTEAKAETPLLWPMMWRTDLLEKTLMLGKIDNRRRRARQRMRWFDGIPNSGWWWRTGKPGVLQSMESQAATLEWVAISFFRGSSWPRDWTQVSCIAGRCFTPQSFS